VLDRAFAIPYACSSPRCLFVIERVVLTWYISTTSDEHPKPVSWQKRCILLVERQIQGEGLRRYGLLGAAAELMVITTEDGKRVDTEKDLSAPERHILQKLFVWESLATSIEQFNEKKDEAFRKGWNNSGPVNEGDSLKSIIRDLQRKVMARLASDGSH